MARNISNIEINCNEEFSLEEITNRDSISYDNLSAILTSSYLICRK